MRANQRLKVDCIPQKGSFDLLTNRFRGGVQDEPCSPTPPFVSETKTAVPSGLQRPSRDGLCRMIHPPFLYTRSFKSYRIRKDEECPLSASVPAERARGGPCASRMRRKRRRHLTVHRVARARDIAPEGPAFLKSHVVSQPPAPAPSQVRSPGLSPRFSPPVRRQSTS